MPNLDYDMRGAAGGLDTSEAARTATRNRPQPDNRGVISYPNYQVAVAQRGDRVIDVANRIGVEAGELARYNGLQPDDALNQGEVLALRQQLNTPGAVAGAGMDPATGTGTAAQPANITQIATTAIGRAKPTPQMVRATPSRRIDGPEPVRHQVTRGETAYSIARLYNVSARALSDWNGLGPNLEVREGQYLLIPVALNQTAGQQNANPPVVAPGTGSATPTPPSAAQPLPDEKIEPIKATQAQPAAPKAPKAVLSKPATQKGNTASSGQGKLLTPVSGKVIRPYKTKKNEGIDIAAASGTAVKAAADGTVAAITRDTDQVPILVLRHPGNLLTVYANIADIGVKKGDKVSRGQVVAKVRKGSPSFLHFEVREGFESVNPAKFLK